VGYTAAACDDGYSATEMPHDDDDDDDDDDGNDPPIPTASPSSDAMNGSSSGKRVKKLFAVGTDAPEESLRSELTMS